MSDVVGIVLAGVHHWDESPLDQLRPRPLLPVAGRPLICAALEWLRSANVRQVVICANSASRAVRRVFGDGSALGLELSYYEDWTPRGPAGCVRDAAWGSVAARFLVVEGTSWPTGDARRLLEEHVGSRAALTVVASRNEQCNLGDDQLLVPTGTYVVEREVLMHVPPTGYQDLKEVLLPRLHERDLLTRVHRAAPAGPRPVHADGYWALNAWVLDRYLREATPALGYRRSGQVELHDTAQVAPTARLLGPVRIGPRTRIEAGAIVEGPGVLGADGVVSSNAVVRTSVLWNDWRVESGALVEHCVLADGARAEPSCELRGLVLGGSRAGNHPLLVPGRHAWGRLRQLGQRWLKHSTGPRIRLVDKSQRPASAPLA
mgnify:CR=1 FL=1